MTRSPGPRPAPRIAILVAVVLGLGVGGCGSGGEDDAGGGGAAPEGSGKVFSPPGKQYTVEIPKGVVEVPTREDRAIPSKTDLSLELEGKVQAGGLIKTGTLSGKAASGTFDAVGAEAARKYASQYEGHPDMWGQGAAVDKKTMKVGGRDAVEVSARFSPSGDAEPSVFFRVYFVEAPAGPPLLITCDWNSSETEDIAAACDTLVASFDVAA